MTLEELKQDNEKAYKSLIDFWAELSRISILNAKHDIEDNLYDRYDLNETENGLLFTDSHAGDTFIYDEEADAWYSY
jgi:hypothetical protein